MAEPEDLIVELAHRGVVAAERLWLRYHPGADAACQRLAGLRPHVELLAAALSSEPVGVRPADPPAPASWAARLADRRPRHLRPAAAAAGTDGTDIYLPRTPPEALLRTGLAPAAIYRLLVAEQVARRERGTALLAPGDPASPERLLYELAEAVASEGWLARVLPGLAADIGRARRAALADRPAL
ncbi:MAG TPA: hypothetical protein VFK09_03645, partial [Gemmatimonadales bacterium]|nr:hypothetical protein [Gemmatimonadales bacterium]